MPCDVAENDVMAGLKGDRHVLAAARRQGLNISEGAELGHIHPAARVGGQFGGCQVGFNNDELVGYTGVTVLNVKCNASGCD